MSTFLTSDSHFSQAEARRSRNHWPPTDFFHWFNICVGESDCEGEDNEQEVVEGDDGAGISESKGIGFVDDWTAG